MRRWCCTILAPAHGLADPALTVINAPVGFLDYLLNPYPQMRAQLPRNRAERAPGPPSMARAQHSRLEVAPSRSLATCQGMDVGSG